MAVKCCVLIFMVFLGVSIAQDITTFDEYKNISSAVIFWENATQSGGGFDPNCHDPYIEYDLIKKYIKNCQKSNNGSSSCQRNCGSYQSFNITCIKYRYRLVTDQHQWFPSKTIPFCTEDRNRYMNNNDAVVFWKAHPDLTKVYVNPHIRCQKPYLQTFVTGNYISNCTTQNEQNGTCYFLCENSTDAINVDIQCWKDEIGNVSKWFPLENHSQHCAVSSTKRITSMSSHGGKSMESEQTSPNTVTTTTTVMNMMNTTIPQSTDSTLESETTSSIVVAASVPDTSKLPLPYLLGGIAVVLGIIIIVSMIIVCKRRSAITDEDEKTEDLEMNNAAFETNDPDYDYPMLNIVEPQVEEEPDYEYIDTVEALRLQRLVQPERQPQVPARPEEKVNECYVPFDGNGNVDNGNLYSTLDHCNVDNGNLYSTLDRGKQCGANGKELPKCELNGKKLPKCEPNGKELPICEEIDNDMYLPSDGKKFPDDSDIEMVNQAMSLDNGKELSICTEVENDMYLSSDSYNIGKKLPTDDGMIDNDLYLTSSEFCSG